MHTRWHVAAYSLARSAQTGCRDPPIFDRSYQNSSPLAIDAQREWEEEQEELEQVDRSRCVYDADRFTLKSLAERSLFCSH